MVFVLSRWPKGSGTGIKYDSLIPVTYSVDANDVLDNVDSEGGETIQKDEVMRRWVGLTQLCMRIMTGIFINTLHTSAVFIQTSLILSP